MKRFPAINDVAVLLIFFCRVEQFARTFEAVKKARPSKLFLYQDGPRADRPDDIKGILACRAIAENIDWECEVHKLYQEKNIGCDPSEYIAQKWAFEHVDKCIILEDDDVASQSFFPYCRELLDRYENDERIAMICGMNHLETYRENGCSYFFADTGPIWGWATWKRVVDTWDPNYLALDDVYLMKTMKENYKDIGLPEHFSIMKSHKKDGRAFYETILGISRFAQNRLCIVPSVNMIRNIGNCMDATHPTANVDHWLYKLPIFDIEFPLKHPKYVVNDVCYSRRVYRKMGGCLSWGDFCLRKVKNILRHCLALVRI